MNDGNDEPLRVPDFKVPTVDDEERTITLTFTGRQAALIAVSFTCVPLQMLSRRDREDLAALADLFVAAIDEQIVGR